MTFVRNALVHFTCLRTKLFMMNIGDSPPYEPPITATCGPVMSWTADTMDPFLPTSSESVRSKALRYSELASSIGKQAKGFD